MDNKQRLGKLVRNMALEVRGPDEAPFVLKSGQTSNYYLDCRKVTLSSDGLEQIVDAMAWLLSSLSATVTVDAIGGPCVGADPIVGGLLLRMAQLHRPCRGFLVRKEGKDHGKAGRVIGSIKPGDRCLLVEDVVTSGQSSVEAIEAIHEMGARVVAVTCLVDRLSGGAAAFNDLGIPFHPLLTINDLWLT